LQQGAGGVFAFSFICKNHDSHAAGGYQQASLTRQRLDFFMLAQRNDCQYKKRQRSCHERKEGNEKHDKLARYEQPAGRHSSFLYLKKINMFIKMCCDGLACLFVLPYCREYRFS